MNWLGAILYTAAVCVFIAWLLCRMRSVNDAGSHAAAVKNATSAPGQSPHRGMTAGCGTISDRPLAPPHDARRDDLTRIKGVGAVIAAKLDALGIVSFAQLAALDAGDIERVDAVLSFKGRIEREDWIGQARRLLAERPIDN